MRYGATRYSRNSLTPPSTHATAEQLAESLRKMIPWAKETLNDREERLEREDDPHNRTMIERCSMELEEAEALLAKVDGEPTEQAA